VRLLFDEQLSEELVTALEDLFPDSLHVRLLGKGGAADPIIWQLAREHGCVLVTKDDGQNSSGRALHAMSESVSVDESARAYEKGRSLLESGDLPGAIVQFELSIAVRPHFKSLELLGEAFLRSGQPVRAIVPLAAATTLDVQVRAPSLLAEALLAVGDSLRAHEVAKLALQRDGNNKKARSVFDATEEEYQAWASS